MTMNTEVEKKIESRKNRNTVFFAIFVIVFMIVVFAITEDVTDGIRRSQADIDEKALTACEERDGRAGFVRRFGGLVYARDVDGSLSCFGAE